MKIQLWARNSGKFTEYKKELIKYLKENGIKVIELEPIIFNPEKLKGKSDYEIDYFKNLWRKYYIDWDE